MYIDVETKFSRGGTKWYGWVHLEICQGGTKKFPAEVGVSMRTFLKKNRQKSPKIPGVPFRRIQPYFKFRGGE